VTNPTPRLDPAQNRGLRELYAGARQLASHWTTLADRLGDGDGPVALRAGAAAARELLDELAGLTAARGLHGYPAAQGVGARVAGLRNAVTDRTFERNQALRFAVLDMGHLTTLQAYLAVLAGGREDEELAEWHGRWERKLKRLETAVRKAAIAEGLYPDSAIAPLDDGTLGRAGHGVANAAGTLGEWFDRRLAERRGAGG